ncbi:thiamine-phosphate kinase [Gemmatimonas sp.]|jgi:thiamine-monophosphate kinase|uniref:thiamine-phosphate kinase n=1 Tax=Gemmatimonas sp. TaxID=1962908 RepID=UPI0037C00EAB
MFNTHGNDFRPHQPMRPGHEFDVIRMLMARWGELAVDIGDDAAVLPAMSGGQRVVSTDACVEDVHFRRSWITPFEVGGRAAAAALSDLAAMGASAEGVLVALVVPPAWQEHLAAVADGIGSQVRRAGGRIVGGNLSTGQTFAITLTVIGRAERPVSRAGARVGDVVVVTGHLGGPGNALAAWRADREPEPWARSRFAAPMPRFAEGRLLAAAGATAMLDISDGLAADARHLAAASGVWLDLDPARIPVGPGLTAASALESGEEYELLATIPPEALDTLQRRWAAETEVPLTVVGRVVASNPEAGDVNGSVAGHDHFA